MLTQTEKRLKAFQLLVQVGNAFATDELPPQDQLDAIRIAIKTGEIGGAVPKEAMEELDEIIAGAEERKDGLHQFTIKLRASNKLLSEVTKEMVMEFVKEEAAKDKGLATLIRDKSDAIENANEIATVIQAMEPAVADKIITSLEEFVEVLGIDKETKPEDE